MSLTPKQRNIVIGVSAAVIGFVALIYFSFIAKPRAITLQVWGIESVEKMTQVFDQFTSGYPHLTIFYTQFSEEEYHQALLKAFADNEAPDVFFVYDTWFPKYQNKAWPLYLPQDKQITVKKLLETYSETSLKPVLVNNSYLYGIPVSIDTLALYYNQDIFNASAIPLPPKTWEEVLDLIPKLRILEPNGRLIRSAIALGTSNNVRWATDILSALMGQLGSPVVDENLGLVVFKDVTLWQNQSIVPAEAALQFYTQFANPLSINYSWNENLPDSVIAFSQGKTALMIGYEQAIDVLREYNPLLNFKISSLPNFRNNPNQNNYARISYYLVSTQTKHPKESWLFLKFLNSNEGADAYYNITHRPPANKNIIAAYLNEPLDSTFLAQSLNSWIYYQYDYEQFDNVFKQMIDDVGIRKLPPHDVVLDGANTLNFSWK